MKHLAALVALIPTAAPALDCLIAPISDSHLQARADGGDFVIVRGTFGFPHPWVLHSEEAFDLPGTFVGHVIAADLTETWTATAVRVRGNCVNGDCGYLEPGAEVITFLHPEGDGFVVYSMPCANYPIPTANAPLKEVVACWTGGDCSGLADLP